MVIVILLLSAFPLACAPEPTESKAPTPNILWLIAEDLGPELGSYGHPEVRTPNLDGLAAEGMRFTHTFTTSPVCSPSRSAFMTGMYQTSIGAHNHRSHRDDGYRLPDDVRVLTDWLRGANYLTGNIVHLTLHADETYFRGTGKTDWNFHYEGEPFDTEWWSDLRVLQPFYAQVNFPETHRGKEWDTAHEHIEVQADLSKVQLPPYYPDHPEARADWAQYLNAVMSLDRKIGFVLALLEQDGLAESTVVIFMGDHGRAMVRGKQWPYDSGLHVPLIIRWPSDFSAPQGYEAGTVSSELISSIDVTATTLSIAGVDPPPSMQGRVFLGESRMPPRRYVFGGRDRGDETVDRIRTVRDARFRYIRNFYPERPFLQLNRYKEFTYPMIPLMRELDTEGKLTSVQARLLAPTRPEEELYDLEADPYEIHNLVEDPGHIDRLHELRGALDDWIVETNDQGRVPEPSGVAAYWEERMSEYYDARIEKMLEERRKRRRE